MKKLLSIVFAVIILFLPIASFGEVESIDRGYIEKIDSFDVDIKLNENGTADISEKIVYDFGNNEKHGIYRIIPTYYKFRNGDPHQRISNFSVTDQNGRKLHANRELGFSKATYIVGDKNTLVKGVNTYLVNYQVSNVMNSTGIFDEFYWNAIGDGWSAKIYNAKVSLSFSSSIDPDKVTNACFAGSFGSDLECTNVTRDNNRLIFYQSYLAPNEALTLQVVFPPNTFPAPSKIETIVYGAPWPWVLPVIFGLVIFYIWWRYGKDPEGRGTIVPFYEAPKDLTPIEAALLLSPFGKKSDLTSEIIYLATRGYIKITRIPKKGFLGKDDYLIEKIVSDTSALPEHDSALLDALLIGDNPTKLTEVKETFYQDYLKVNDKVFKAVKKKGYFLHRPIFVIVFYEIAAFVLLFLLGVSGYYLFGFSVKLIPFLLPGLMLVVFSFLMPKRTKLGSQVREELLGLKMYIRAAEADRIKFHNEPKKDPKKFEELLPYAIVFGLEKEWAKQFEGIYKKEPTWYAGNGYAFSAIALTDQIHTFSGYTNVNLASSASSGGGGFAGGGGGGGGGGSW